MFDGINFELVVRTFKISQNIKIGFVSSIALHLIVCLLFSCTILIGLTMLLNEPSCRSTRQWQFDLKKTYFPCVLNISSNMNAHQQQGTPVTEYTNRKRIICMTVCVTTDHENYGRWSETTNIACF